MSALCRVFVLTALLIATLSDQTLAADLQVGLEAYNRGDYAAALRVFRSLAEQGNAKAQYNLGRMYAAGRGVARNGAEAVKWYRRAAEQDDAEAQVAAQNSLGVMYADGLGVPEDIVQAAAWISIAYAQGADSEIVLELMRSEMSREENSRAQRLTREYWKACVEPFQ